MTTAAAAPTVSPKVSKLFERNVSQIKEYIKLCDLPEDVFHKRADSISQWDVAQQIDHIAQADGVIMMSILNTLKSPPENVEGRPIPIGRIMLLTGFIPRGKGKAPQSTLPKAAKREDVRADLEKALKHFQKLQPRLGEISQSPGRSPHPMLGMFNGTEWLRFMDAHHYHHMKIIRDIQRAA